MGHISEKNIFLYFSPFKILSDVIKMPVASEQISHPLSGGDLFKKLLIHTERERISLFDLFAEFADPATWTISSDQLYIGVKVTMKNKLIAGSC